jgi:hypothetical protein
LRSEILPDFRTHENRASICGTAITVQGSDDPAQSDDRMSVAVSSALELIDGVGLGFLVDAGIAGVVMTDSRRELSALGMCQAAPDDSPWILATYLLRAAAFSFWADWELAEMLCGGEIVVTERDRGWALKCFADSILLEFYQRNTLRPGAHDAASSIEEFLVGEASSSFDRIVQSYGISTLTELWCFMFGGWDRRQFNSRSATNLLSELRPLNECERAQFLSLI